MRTTTLLTWLAASSAVTAYSFPAAALNSTYLERRSPEEGPPAGGPKTNAKPEPQQGGGGGGGRGGGRGGGGGGGGGYRGGGGGGGGERGGGGGGGGPGPGYMPGYPGPGGGGGGGGGQGGGNGGEIIPGIPIGIPFMPGGGGGGGAPPMPYQGPPPSKCPPIWFKIGKDLIQRFTAGVPGGQCNDLARSAIRIAFHDCASWNMKLGNSAGCDGSLYLAKEYKRRENSGLESVVPQFGQMAQQYGVGVADFFQFAGAHAVVTCPLGPTVQTFVGRLDRSTPNPEGLLPNPRAPADSLVRLFQEKGISPAELAALLGAHSTSRQFAFDPAKTGAALDSTPGVWDVAFYGETLKGNAPFILPSDIVLSKHPAVAPAFKSFVNAQVPWNKAYSPAMTKMSLMGVERGPLIDCTAALPPPKEKRKQS